MEKMGIDLGTTQSGTAGAGKRRCRMRGGEKEMVPSQDNEILVLLRSKKN